MSREAAPNPASEAAPEEIPPVFGSALGGGGGGAAFAATGAGGGGAIFGGGGGGGGGGLQLPFASTSPALASGHGPPLAVAPPALASGGVCAKAGAVITIAATTTAAIVKTKIMRLKYATSFHFRNPSRRSYSFYVINISNSLASCNSFYRGKSQYLVFLDKKHTALCVCRAPT